MNTRNIYTERLKKFAVHLQSIEQPIDHWILKTVVFKMKVGNKWTRLEIQTPYWIYDELPELFPEYWGYCGKNCEPILESKEPKGKTIESVFEFFGIESPELFCHLFDYSGNQNTQLWGGSVLSLNSNGADISFNILRYVRSQKGQGQ